MSEKWNKFNDIHDTDEQKKRAKSACSPKLTPLSVDQINESAVFQGSNKKYNTTLESCQCVDFGRRKKPCKHMYRLAMELNLFSGDFCSDISASKQRTAVMSFSDFLDIVETLSENSQKILLKLLYDFIYAKEPYGLYKLSDGQELFDCNILTSHGAKIELLHFFRRNELNNMIIPLNVDFKKNMKREALIDWCIANLSDRIDELLKGYTSVKLSDDFYAHRTKLYKYLHRKYNSESYLDPETMEMVSVPLIKIELPDDSITSELIKRGYYNPKSLSRYSGNITYES